MIKAALDINLSDLDVLVVEDDPISLLLVSRTLSQYGARVKTATNGSAGLRMFEQHRFPIIITDIYMPGMSGLDLVGRIKALNQDTQIIAISASSETDCLVSAIELGFSDYFIKPVKIEKLLWSVKKCVDVVNSRQRLEDERNKFKVMVDSMGEGVSINDLDYRIQYQNRALIEMIGDRIGSYCYEVFGNNEPCQDCPTILALKDGQRHLSCRSFTFNESTIHVESTASLLRNSRGVVTGTVEIIRDISERIENEKHIREQAFLDPLTGLANRRLFEDRLDQAIAKSRRYGTQFALLILDLDHFKDVNDTLGHDPGDQVLREAADRIRACCKRDLDTISRLGGDEFCIICADCGDREQLSVIAHQLLSEFARPFQLGESQITVTASLGISTFPDNGTEAEELEITADRAMYAAKKAGRNTYRYWEPNTKPPTAF
ncbi:MAG: diguanylate cyclase [Desulfuromonadales bacterium]|nr:diguanylate cyclase [Desulfuromonadales bacterium]